MLDAFIIDQLRREKERPEEEFVPLTLELPIPEQEIRDEKEEKERKKQIEHCFRF